MASLRPEGALNSAKGLVEIGRTEDALEALHQVLSNRRYRQWNATMEKIAEEYVRLCLSAGKTRYAKDGLIQFRNICQPNNLQSVDGILRLFRSLAEEKVRSTRGKLTTGADGLVDLDETESGESLLLSALSADPSVADERAARSALRDLWDALRTILEVCRNHAALDETYHATAIMAFDFCSEFTRKNEFRRICETLRLHQQQSYSRTSSSAIAAGLGQNAVAPVDPLARTIETRNYQMKVAIELGLWTVAFHTVEEMHFLLAKKRPSPAQLTSYYSNLAKILYQSSNAQQHQLFHAVCLLKLFNLSSTASADVLRPIADQATLAVLSAAVADSLVLAASESLAPSGEGPENAIDFAAEKATRLSMLTGSGSVPTPQSLVSDLISKDILSHCSEGVRNLYSVLTDEASSTKESGWINARVPALITALPAELKQYIPALSRLALVKITKDMQAMYSCIGFAKFESLTGAILDLPAAVRLLGQLKRTEQIDVSVDYSSGTISFGSSPSASSGVSAVAGAVATIHSAASTIRAEKSADSILERAHAILFDEDTFFARLDADRRRCDDRRNASDARKAALEQGAVRKAQELADQLRRAEEERLESDARARAAEAARREALAKKREEELVKTKAIVEKMTALGGAAEVAALTEDQLVGMGVAKLEQLQKEQFAKERQDRINKRRNESRRLEHTARLVRVAENEKITEWASTVYATDKEQFAQVAAERAQEWRKAAEAKKAAVNALLPFDQLLASWKTKQVDEFNKKVAIKAEERRARLTAQAAASKPEDDEEKESVVAPTSAMSRDEFKEMAKSLPSWKDALPVDSVE